MATLNDEIVEYSSELAVNFGYADGTTLNNVILDYVEIAWCTYFAVMFGLVGTDLRRCSNLIYTARMLGFYAVWTDLRKNPAFIEPRWLETMMSVILASIVTGTTTKLFKLGPLLEAFTVFSLGSKYVIEILDPMMRRRAGCDDKPGPPSPDMPSGVWLNCEDWAFAFGAVWLYAGFVYGMLFIAGCFGYCVNYGKRKGVRRLGREVSVAAVSSSAAVTAFRAMGRRSHSHAWFENLMFYSFWILIGVFFISQETWHRTFRDKKWSGKCCCGNKYCNITCLVNLLAWPLKQLEKMMYRVERKILAINQKEDERFKKKKKKKKKKGFHPSGARSFDAVWNNLDFTTPGKGRHGLQDAEDLEDAPQPWKPPAGHRPGRLSWPGIPENESESDPEWKDVRARGEDVDWDEEKGRELPMFAGFSLHRSNIGDNIRAADSASGNTSEADDEDSKSPVPAADVRKKSLQRIARRVSEKKSPGVLAREKSRGVLAREKSRAQRRLLEAQTSSDGRRRRERREERMAQRTEEREPTEEREREDRYKDQRGRPKSEFETDGRNRAKTERNWTRTGQKTEDRNRTKNVLSEHLLKRRKHGGRGARKDRQKRAMERRLRKAKTTDPESHGTVSKPPDYEQPLRSGLSYEPPPERRGYHMSRGDNVGFKTPSSGRNSSRYTASSRGASRGDLLGPTRTDESSNTTSSRNSRGSARIKFDDDRGGNRKFEDERDSRRWNRKFDDDRGQDDTDSRPANASDSRRGNRKFDDESLRSRRAPSFNRNESYTERSQDGFIQVEMVPQSRTRGMSVSTRGSSGGRQSTYVIKLADDLSNATCRTPHQARDPNPADDLQPRSRRGSVSRSRRSGSNDNRRSDADSGPRHNSNLSTGSGRNEEMRF